MGNFLSGAKARLIFNGRVVSAANLIKSNCWHMNRDIASISREAINAF
jgi:hypothetical protein